MRLCFNTQLFVHAWSSFLSSRHLYTSPLLADPAQSRRWRYLALPPLRPSRHCTNRKLGEQMTQESEFANISMMLRAMKQTCRDDGSKTLAGAWVLK
jgi:hypothetical protein